MMTITNQAQLDSGMKTARLNAMERIAQFVMARCVPNNQSEHEALRIADDALQLFMNGACLSTVDEFLTCRLANAAVDGNNIRRLACTKVLKALRGKF